MVTDINITSDLSKITFIKKDLDKPMYFEFILEERKESFEGSRS